MLLWPNLLCSIAGFLYSTDRRSVFVNLRSHVPEKLLLLDSETRTVQATNDHDNLKVYFYFSEPVLNSSVEILNSINASQGALLPISGANYGNRRFGFMVSWFTLFIYSSFSLLPFKSLETLHMYNVQFICTLSSQVTNVSSIAIITIGLVTESIISSPGTPVSPIEPVTFLYGINHILFRRIRLCFFPYDLSIDVFIRFSEACCEIEYNI